MATLTALEPCDAMMVIIAQQELKMLFRPLQPNSLADQSLQGLVHNVVINGNCRRFVQVSKRVNPSYRGLDIATVSANKIQTSPEVLEHIETTMTNGHMNILHGSDKPRMNLVQ
jgi:hypothetical protein